MDPLPLNTGPPLAPPADCCRRRAGVGERELAACARDDLLGRRGDAAGARGDRPVQPPPPPPLLPPYLNQRLELDVVARAQAPDVVRGAVRLAQVDALHGAKEKRNEGRVSSARAGRPPSPVLHPPPPHFDSRKGIAPWRPDGEHGGKVAVSDRAVDRERGPGRERGDRVGVGNGRGVDLEKRDVLQGGGGEREMGGGDARASTSQPLPTLPLSLTSCGEYQMERACRGIGRERSTSTTSHHLPPPLSSPSPTGAVDPSKNSTSHPPTVAPATCALVAMMPAAASTTKPEPVA